VDDPNFDSIQTDATSITKVPSRIIMQVPTSVGRHTLHFKHFMELFINSMCSALNAQASQRTASGIYTIDDQTVVDDWICVQWNWYLYF
jgi:hypothetical protein